MHNSNRRCRTNSEGNNCSNAVIYYDMYELFRVSSNGSLEISKRPASQEYAAEFAFRPNPPFGELAWLCSER